MTINVKISLKDILQDFNNVFLKINLLLQKKEFTVYNHSGVLQSDLFSFNQENNSEITFVTGAAKIKSKILKPCYDWIT